MSSTGDESSMSRSDQIHAVDRGATKRRPLVAAEAARGEGAGALRTALSRDGIPLLLRRLVGRYLASSAVSGFGERLQALEQEIARRRLLDQARGAHGFPAGDASRERERRVSYDAYLSAAALTLARRHRPVWCWRRWRRACRCGGDLPCHSRHRIPINRGHWPHGSDE
nr:hypothetical protein [Micromonospora provocatoris]